MKTLCHLNSLAAIALVAAAGPVSAGTAHRTSAVTYYPRADDLPASEAVRVDNQLLLGMQLGVADDGKTVVPGGWEAETRRAMTNIDNVLKKHGLGFGDITLCTVMLADIEQWAAFNGVYASYFHKGHYPARRVFGVSGLPRGGHVGIACQARLRS